MSLFKKLLEIRKNVDFFQKTETGNQGAMYADPAVILATIRNKMNDLGILLYPSLSNSSVESIPDPTKNNENATSFIFKSDMLYTFVDAETDEKLEVPWFITGKHLQDPSMAGGGALTFYERYFLLKFFQIPTSKDDPEFFADKMSEKISEEDLIILSEIVEGRGYKNPDFVLSHYAIKIAKCGDIKSLPKSKFEHAKNFLNEIDGPTS